MKRQLFLLDAYALIYRGYFAFIRNPRINSKGMNTSAIFGFLLTFDEIRKKAENGYLAVVFDPKGPTFRHEAYPEYKAQREETPEAIREGVPYIKKIIDALGITRFEVSGYEADDVIGTISRLADNDTEVMMVTPDKDYAQLVTENARIMKPAKGGEFEIMGPDEVISRYDIQSQDQIIDLLALMGDSGDNIPGCPGIGEKTAAKLLRSYKDINDIYDHIEEIKGANKRKLQEGESLVRQSRELVTICTEVPMDFDIESCRVGEMDQQKITDLFEELEFKTLLQRYQIGNSPSAQPPEKEASSTPSTTQQPGLFDDLFAPKAEVTTDDPISGYRTINDTPHDYKTADTPEGIAQLVQELETSSTFAFDTETDSLDALSSGIVGVSFSSKAGTATYIPLPSDHAEVCQLLAPLAPVFADKNKLKVGQNLKFDIEVLSRYGLDIQPPFFDTMIAHYLLNPELSHGMDYMAENYLNYRPVPISSLIGPKGKKQLSMRDIAPATVSPYASEDADITLQLYEFLAPQIEERELTKLFYDLEMPLMEVLTLMEQTGVTVDSNALQEVAQDLEQRLKQLEEEIYTSAGVSFNINSPKVVGEVLFETLKLGGPKPKKTKTGNYVTREDELVKLRNDHPVVEMILRYRGLKKLLSTYVEALPALISPTTGRIHTTYNQTVTSTGRLSSTNPNLQNIPIRDDDGREIRRAFTANHPDSEVFVSADYSQIELRLMAHLSGDEALIEAFRSGTDVHAATAAKIYGISLDEVTSEYRRRAKTANFGIIYGISTFGLSERLDIPRKEASELIEGYFRSYPGVKSYMEEAVIHAREKGYVETLLGRRRYLKDINANNAVVRGYAERNAINAPIQGTAADIIKVAMVRITRRLREEGLRSQMILQVHDELNFSAPKEEVETLKSLIREEMEGVLPQLSVPLTVEVGEGSNWLEAH